MLRTQQLVSQLCTAVESKIPSATNLTVKTDQEIRNVCISMLPSWSRVQSSAIMLKAVKGGITNKLVLASATHNSNELKALVRLFGDNTEVLINREVEEKNLSEMTKLNYGMKLLATFKNGRIEEWFDKAHTLEDKDVQDPVISRMIAKKLAEMHVLPIQGDTSPVLYPSLRKWLKIALECDFKEPEKRKRILALNLDRLHSEIGALEKELSAIPSPVVFAHNDLLPGNILCEWKSNRMELIDFEYGGYNYRGFDIGNHFNEFSGFDYDKILEVYPNKTEQYNFFEAYMRELKGGGRVSNDELDSLYVEVNKYALASHIYWGLWAVVQARFSAIDFDYLNYARQRLGAYYDFKERFRNL